MRRILANRQPCARHPRDHHKRGGLSPVKPKQFVKDTLTATFRAISVELRRLNAILKDQPPILLILRLAVDNSLEAGL